MVIKTKKPAEAKLSEEKPVEEKPSEEKPSEEKPAVDEVKEEQPSQKQGKKGRKRGQNKKRPYTFKEELSKQLCPSLVCFIWYAFNWCKFVVCLNQTLIKEI